jgi:hypothetical protein
MDKKTIIFLLGVLPAMKTAATFLRFKDDNSIGADDLIAELIERNAKIIETYLLTGQIPQELRDSLPADLAAKL